MSGSQAETVSRRSAQAAQGLLFDREEALASLLGAFEDAADSESLVIATLPGDAGLGKTRLLIEFESRLDRLAEETRPRVGYGRALASDSVGAGYQPLREALADLLVGEERRGKERLKKLGNLLKDTAPDWLDALPVVGGVLHALAVTVQHVTADRKQLPDSMNAQFAALLEAIADDRPVVLLLDDLHWADSSSVESLFFLTQRLRRPLLLVLAFRLLDLRGREDHHPLRQVLWRMERYCPLREIRLNPLSEAAVARLAEQVLADAAYEPQAVRWLVQASEGNPLYVQEFLWHLHDLRARTPGATWEGLFEPRQGERRVGLPRTLEAVVAERLEELAYEELRVLQLASVIGAEFGVEELLALSDMGEEPTKRALRLLCQRIGLLKATQDGRAYLFYHGLVREYVTARHQRDDPVDFRDVHKLRAEFLANRPNQSVDWTGRVAYHYHMAGSDEEALVYALEAAQEARDSDAASEAAQYLKWAAEHADRGGFDHESALARCALGEVQQELIRIDAAVTTLEEAARRAPAAGLSPVQEFDLLVELAKAHRMEEHWDEARQHLHGAEALQPDADPDRQAYVRLVHAEIRMSGEPRDLAAADALLQEAAGLATSKRLLAAIYGHQGFIALAHEEVSRSRDLFQQAHELAQRAGSIGRLYETHLWLAKHALACLRLGDAEHELAEMADLAQRLGVGQTVAHHCRDTGRRHALAGQLPEAVAAYASYLSHMLDHPAWTSRALTYLLLQGRELRDELDQGQAGEFFSRLRHCLGDTPQLRAFTRAAELMHLALERGEDPAARIAQTELGAYLVTDQARATDLVFRFHLDDLTGFRRGHDFAAPQADDAAGRNSAYPFGSGNERQGASS